MNNESEIKRLADELDALVPRDSALVDIHQCHKPAGHIIHGNERGLLRLGIELIRSASELPDGKTDAAQGYRSERVGYLSAHPSQGLLSLWRDESIKKQTLEEFLEERGIPKVVPLRTKLLGMLASLFVYGFVALAICGAFALIRRIL